MSADVAEFPHWRRLLRTRKSGEPFGDELNVITTLENAPELVGSLQYDEFGDRVQIFRCPPWRDSKHFTTPADWTDEHRTELQAWLQANNVPVNRPHVVQDAVIAVAKRSSFHPVREYLDGLKWDAIERLPDWLADYLGADGDQRYLSAVGPRMLIAAVARVLRPGCKADHVPALEGPQGIGKSTVVRLLAEPWTCDSVPDLTSKDAAIQIQGVWMAELAELTSMSRSDVEHIKAFLSRSSDRYRPPYGRNAVDRPRHCTFVATTNLLEYLRDETGNRRFWPVRCRNIDLDALHRDRDQLWAEAVARYKQAEQWHLPRELEPLAETEQELRRLVPENEHELREYLDHMREQGHTELLMRDILRGVGGIEDFSRQRYEAGALAQQFSRVLTSAGWEKLRPIGRGERRRQPYRYVGLTSTHKGKVGV